MSNPRSNPQSGLPDRSELLAGLSGFLVRLDEIVSARRSDSTSDLELPLRRLQTDLYERSEFASWYSSLRMATAYSLAVQDAAALIDELRTLDDAEQWFEAAERTKQALQRAVVRVRRLHD